MHVIFIESNTTGTGYDALRWASESALTCTLLTSQLSLHLSCAPTGLLSGVDVVECDTSSLRGVLRGVGEKACSAAAVLTYSDYHVRLAAEVGGELGLPCLNLSAAKIVSSKVAQREFFSQKNGSPRFAVVSPNCSVEEISRSLALQRLFFPVIVKPDMESGGRGVSVCRSFDDVLLAIGEIRKRKKNLFGQDAGRAVLIEEYLDGVEYSVECVASGEDVYVIGVTKKILGGRSKTIELGHIFPAPIDPSTKNMLADYAADVIRLIGFDVGVAHVELIVDDSGGVNLIEINGRPAGDNIHRLVEACLGFGLVEAHALSYLGGLVLPGKKEFRESCFAAIAYQLAKPGLVESIVKPEGDGVLCHVLCREGDVFGCVSDNGHRVAYAIATGATAAAAFTAAEQGVLGVRIKYSEAESVAPFGVLS